MIIPNITWHEHYFCPDGTQWPEEGREDSKACFDAIETNSYGQTSWFVLDVQTEEIVCRCDSRAQASVVAKNRARMSAVEMLAECNASMDGKLTLFRTDAFGSDAGCRDGYTIEAAEIIDRLEARGYTVRKL